MICGAVERYCAVCDYFIVSYRVVEKRQLRYYVKKFVAKFIEQRKNALRQKTLQGSDV